MSAVLEALGWTPALASAWAARPPDQLRPGRVVSEERGSVRVATDAGEVSATIAGRLRHDADLGDGLFPGVGDWVALGDAGAVSAIVHAVLPRATAIVRRAPTDRSRPTQILAANVDVAFVVMSLNADFNLRRLERYLAAAWESGATPVVLLSKADLDPDVESKSLAASAVAPGVDVIPVSAVTGDGLDLVRSHLSPGTTVVFIGSSGVGKSSLVNALAGEPLLETAAIREDDARGRHTTTRRQLLRLADGLVIDTPGLRELALADGDGLAEAFDDLEAIARGCRFRDCGHAAEPGCAVQAALAEGRLAPERLASFRKLEREGQRAERAANPVVRKAERRRWSAMMKNVERRMDVKYGTER
jgi:ribosome biogenesis GTPase